MSDENAVSAIKLFEQVFTAKPVSLSLGVAPSTVHMLHQRWQLRGRGAPVTRERRQYDVVTKLEIVLREVRGESGRALADEYGLRSPSTVATWTHVYRRDGEDGLRPKKRGRPPTGNDSNRLPRGEIEALHVENERLRVWGHVSGKITSLAVAGTTLKVRAVDDLKAQDRLPVLLQIAALPRSTFYDHRRRLGRANKQASLKEPIHGVFQEARGASGHRRIRAVLLRRGWNVSKKAVCWQPCSH